MTLELTYLIWSAALGFVYLNVEAGLYRLQAGIKQANGVRDDDPQPNVLTGRGRRAFHNFLESYGLFIALAAATVISGRGDALTALGCQLYFWARLAYLPLYVFGISPARSIVWSVSIVGLVLLFIGVAF